MLTVSLHPHLSVPLPAEPRVNVGTITAIFISLSWSVPTDQMVTSSEVMWRVASSGSLTTNGEHDGTSGSITDTSYTIEGLRSSTSYLITVTVTNVAGSTTSSPVMVTTTSLTTTEGECIVTHAQVYVTCNLVFYAATATSPPYIATDGECYYVSI